jgi:hypothetical protein
MLQKGGAHRSEPFLGVLMQGRAFDDYAYLAPDRNALFDSR